ncbi:MAG: DNA-directed RNA polymerase subunit omega [Phycisphaerae bacterium]|nr:DNA-directed RNA polymerase subunit omega [Phycisphaerae bacterium]
MIEMIKDEDLIIKVGGNFRLTALVQRRCKEIIEGSRPLVDTTGLSIIEIALKEIRDDKIEIDYDKSIGLAHYIPEK